MADYFEMGRALAQRRRQDQIANILARHVTDAQPGVSGDAVGPGAAPAPVSATPATFDPASALPELAKAGFGPEAIQMGEVVNGPTRDRQKLILEYSLKDALQKGQWDRAVALMNNGAGGSPDLGTKLTLDHNGPKIEFDPARAADVNRENAKAGYEFGYTPAPRGMLPPGAQPVSQTAAATPNAVPSGVTPKASAELAAKRMEHQPEDLNQLTALSSDLDRLTQQAKELSQHPGLPYSTGATAALGYIPNTDAYNFRAALESLKSKIAFNVLGSLRAQSHTGGALGQVSNFEEQMLQNAIDSIDRGQSPEEVKNSLLAISAFGSQSKKRLADQYKNVYGVAPNVKSYTAPSSGGGNAPQAAIDYLHQNNTPDMQAKFKAKYGYLPGQ